MSNGKRGSPDPGARRRRPATIDLKATEIASEPVKSTEPTDIPNETPQAEPQPEVQAAGPVPPPSPEPSPPEPPPAAPEVKAWTRPEWLGTAGERISALRERAKGQTDWRLFGAGIVGAAVMLALFLLILATGMFQPRDESAALTARIAAAETQVRELAGRPQPPGVDQRALADLAARVGAAEQAMGRVNDIEGRLARAEQSAGRIADLDSRLAKAETAAAAPPRADAPPDAALAGRIAALEATTKQFADIAPRLDAATTAARDAKSRADAAFETAQKSAPAAATQAADHQAIEALTTRVAALEASTKAAQERIAATAGADKAGRLAFVAVSLRAAVERGDPFASELAAVRPLVADAKALSPLEPFAAGGIPRVAALSRELTQLTGAMLNAAGSAPREGGFMEKLQQNAERLVRIRPINEAPGDDPATIVTRADVKATHGDLSGAVAELASLPPPVRAVAQGWVGKVEARSAALNAARNLADNAVGALAKP